MNIKQVAAKINKAWKEDVLTTGDIISTCEKVSLGSIGADYALYGGIPLGCLSIYSGLQHSGKTLAACQAMAQYQKAYPDRVCIYIDAENTMVTQQEFLVRMTGLITNDENRFLKYSCTGKSAEEIFADIIELQQADDIGMIVLDSAPALVSASELDADFKKDLGMRASIAKVLSKFLKQMIMYLPKRNNPFIIINQVREAGKTFTGATIYTEPCGHALQYYPSIKVRFGTRTFTSGDKYDLAASKGEDADGFRLKFSITKSRLGDLRRGGGFLTYRYDTGLDTTTDTIEVATKFGFINRPNLQTYELLNLDNGEILYDEDGNELRFRGRQAMVDYISGHEAFREKYIEMLNRHISDGNISGKSLLDEKDMNEILSQEDSVEKHFTISESDEMEEE